MSHLDWIGSLPASWTARPLRAVADYLVSNVDKVPDDEEAPVRLCNYTDVYNNEFITLGLDFMDSSATEAEVARFGLRVNDVIITKDSETWDDIGVSALVRETAPDLVCGYHLALLRPHARDLDGAFLFRTLQAKPVLLQLELAANGVTRFGISRSDIGAMILPIPPLSNQRTIVNFLDRELTRLDALVAAKVRLLAHLNQKRKALITRAVTRGLDSRAELRSSGVPWLGDIPAHWRVIALRFLVDVAGGATPDTGYPAYWDGDIPWVSPKDMKADVIGDAQDHVSPAALAGTALQLLPPGQVLVVVRGMILAHSFPVAITTDAVTINQDMKALQVRSGLGATYLRDFLRGVAGHVVSIADSSAHGTRKIDTEVLGRLEVCVPPPDEQDAIVAYIEDVTGRIDSIIGGTQVTLELLKERRAALITGAITGRVAVA